MAQQPSPPSHIETVIVTAEAKGPPIWHATKGEGDVAILGIVQPLPDNFAWNRKRLMPLLDHAHRVLLPPQIRMGIFSGAWFYLTEGELLRPSGGKALRQVLDPHIAEDLAQACKFLHEPGDRYDDNSPIIAATRLSSDFRHVFYLTTHEPEDIIATLARVRHVAVRRIATYDLVPSAEDLLKLPSAKTGTCIEASIRDITYQAAHVQAAANAWALGDVAGMMANSSPSNYYGCLVRLSPHATAIDTRSIDDTVQSVNAALASGERTLVIADVGLLLRGGGVFDRLKATGVSITDP